MKNVIPLTKTERMIKGKSCLLKPWKGSTDKKRGLRFYMPLFFFCMNFGMNFHIHEHRFLVQLMQVLLAPCLCVGKKQEANNEKVEKHSIFHKAESPCLRRAL